jgi:uncharacterized protein
MRVTWTAAKATLNFRKHGVSFEEARTVFGDPLAVIFDDDAHSFEERRAGIFGRSDRGRLIAVSFAEKPDDTIRIISARLLTPREAREYGNRT